MSMQKFLFVLSRWGISSMSDHEKRANVCGITTFLAWSHCSILIFFLFVCFLILYSFLFSNPNSTASFLVEMCLSTRTWRLDLSVTISSLHFGIFSFGMVIPWFKHHLISSYCCFLENHLLLAWTRERPIPQLSRKEWVFQSYASQRLRPAISFSPVDNRLSKR